MSVNECVTEFCPSKLAGNNTTILEKNEHNRGVGENSYYHQILEPTVTSNCRSICEGD